MLAHSAMNNICGALPHAIMQLKIHIQEQSYNYPMMDDEYIPVAANSTTVIEFLNDSPYTRQVTPSSEHILFFCPFSVAVIILSLIMIVMILYARSGIVKFKSSVGAKLESNQSNNTGIHSCQFH